AAAAALAVLVVVYFGAVRALGFETVSYSEPLLSRGWPVWSIFVLVSLAPGILEEIAFRGVVLERLRGVVAARDALVIQAALFAVLHLSPLVFPSHFAIGIILGWLRQRTKSLYPGMLVHAGYNAILVAMELGG